MGQILGSLEPKAVWEYFEEICKYPHPSKKETKLASYILNWAKKNQFETYQDKTGNIILKKPATKGMENRKPIAIQGHIDMVTEKNNDVKFDFDNDSIQTYIDGDWVKAKGTTLGADNGIGVSMGMALMTSTDIPHPPLELLLTVDEETGLTGAMQLEAGKLQCEILINLDSEEDGTFTIGCAGGQNSSGVYKYKEKDVPSDTIPYEIALKGMKGGHSGIEIHTGRANSLKLITRVLMNLTNKFGIRLTSINGGNKHNAIPREAFAVVNVAKGKEKAFLSYISDFDNILKTEYQSKEPGINLTAVKTKKPKRVMSKTMQNGLLKSFYAMPHGVIRMSPDMADLVQTSTNFAVVETRAKEVYVLTSQRSSVATEIDDISAMVRYSMELGGAKVTQGDSYPAWQPNVNSPILHEAQKIYKRMYKKEPVVQAIHAGLETGLIGEKYPGMDMLSFGPNLKDVHSPDERVEVSTTKKCWELLVEIVKNIPEKK
jgi:dipeptidase D